MDEPGKYDLNLLRVFVLVYETRSVTEAAEILAISQPSVSYALSKLRKLFGDPLFHRGPKGLEATPTASGLYPELSQSLRMIDSAVQGVSEFDPASTSHRFRLMMTDLGLMALFPYIVSAVLEAAPNVRLDVIPLDISQLHDRLRRNEIDAAIGIPAIPESDVLGEHLMDMPYVGVCARTHPRISDSPSMEEIAAEKHVVVSKALGHEHVVHRLAELGVRDSVTITLPSFAVVAQTLAVTDHISVVPKALADIIESHGSVRQFALPFNIAPGRVTLYTYRRDIPSPPVDWLREIIATSLTQYPYPKYVRGAGLRGVQQAIAVD
ncbi:LysR family transcriptional regulator [Arthrobacter sp. Y81]|uniref:LysR family transcriptional regulator n=1 Tax=Arthrobacter sp. Y81 TaxID=2058897 RepID=UPI000CE53D2E|nr:LysR family transcriptional regulator [Arthrobacter sp. Y81]